MSKKFKMRKYWAELNFPRAESMHIQDDAAGAVPEF